MVLELNMGDVLRMKKAHPCGSLLWTVTRLGADIGMVCQECGRYVLMPRSQLARRLLAVVPSDEQSGPGGV
jgi:hypothetical protein